MLKKGRLNKRKMIFEEVSGDSFCLVEFHPERHPELVSGSPQIRSATFDRKNWR